MNSIWNLRIILIILILVLGAIGVNNPILKKFDLVEEEGKDISLTFVKIVNVENNRYTVQTDFTGEQMVVVSDGFFNFYELFCASSHSYGGSPIRSAGYKLF